MRLKTNPILFGLWFSADFRF